MDGNRLYKSYPNNKLIKPVSRSEKNFNIFKSSWTIEAIDAPGAWLIPTTSEEVNIGVVDSGLNISHRDLKGLKVLSTKNIKDNSGHGTAVIGIFGAQHNIGEGMAGICPKAGVLVKKVEERMVDGLFKLITISNNDQMSKRCKEALTDIYNEVIKNSTIKIVILAKARQCKNEQVAEDFSSVYYHDIIEKLLKKGIIVILAGANEDVPVEKCYPAMMKKKLLSTYNNLLIISSCDKPDGMWEGNIKQSYPKQTLADILAPGTNQVTLSHKGVKNYNIPVRKHKNTSGNSLAIPHVAGVAALLFRINPRLSGEQVSQIIKKSAEDQISGGKVLNAFTAALNAYNYENTNIPLYGYRFIFPSGYDGGLLEINGEYLVEIVTIRYLGQTSFCRFVSNEDNLRIRVFAPIYDDSNNCKISDEPIWEGTTDEIIRQADKGSKDSAWISSNCKYLKTIRIQGISLQIFDDNTPLANKTILLKKDKAVFKGVTNSKGYVNIPFGETGSYTIEIYNSDNSNDYEDIILPLEKNNIYDFDPRDSTGNIKILKMKKKKENVISCWAGQISINGIGELKNNNYINALGQILFKGTTNKINNTIFLDNCYDSYFPNGITLEEAIDEWGEDFANDDIPSFDSIRIRAFSEMLYKLKNDFTVDDDYLDSYIYEYQDGSEIPKGYLISDNGELILDLPLIINQLIDASFKYPNDIYYPFTIDITFAWFVDNVLIGDDVEFTMTLLTTIIEPYEIPIEEISISNTNKIKLVAGPCQSKMKFITNSASNIELINDENKKDNYITGVIDAKDVRSIIYVVGSKGEIGRIQL